MSNKEYRDAFFVADNSNTISAQIATMRHSRKWTQKELADRCGMRQPRISSLEDPEFDNVEIATLQRIASAFDVALLVSFVRFSELARRATDANNSDFSVVEFARDAIGAPPHQNISANQKVMELQLFDATEDGLFDIRIDQLYAKPQDVIRFKFQTSERTYGVSAQ